MKQPRALAIQDISCIGRCSLTAALPILSAAGIETAVLPTALLSTQTAGFSDYTYLDLTEQMLPIIEHWRQLGERFDAIYSGFLGSVQQIEPVLQAFRSLRHDGTLILVDPVMADFGELYPVFTMEMAVQMRRLCREADLIVPNLTEAALLLGEPHRDEPYDEQRLRTVLLRLTELGCRRALLTGVSLQPGRIGAACYDAQTDVFSYADQEAVAGVFYGTGDVFASALLAALLRGSSLEQAMRIAVEYTGQCVTRTFQEGRSPCYGLCFEQELPSLLRSLGIL